MINNFKNTCGCSESGVVCMYMKPVSVCSRPLGIFHWTELMYCNKKVTRNHYLFALLWWIKEEAYHYVVEIKFKISCSMLQIIFYILFFWLVAGDFRRGACSVFTLLDTYLCNSWR
jgi:hypothetical protein